MKYTKVNTDFDFSDTELIEALKERLDIRQFVYSAENAKTDGDIKALYNQLQALQTNWNKRFN